MSQDTGQHKARITLSWESLPVTWADNQKLCQAFLNLVQNASQAAGIDGIVTINAFIEQSDNEDFIVIHFDDNGAGVSLAIRDKLFEPFFTTKTDGTGLGLSTTRKIIEGHGGTIDVDSTPAGGARFIVHLPVRCNGAEDMTCIDTNTACVG
jgi:signal transduction histidine kinase